MCLLLYPYMVIIVLAAGSQSWFYFWATFEPVKFNDGADSYTIRGSLKLFEMNGSLRSGVIGFIVAIACIFLNGCAAVFLFCQKNALKKQGGINLFLIAFVDFSIHLVYAMNMLLHSQTKSTTERSTNDCVYATTMDNRFGLSSQTMDFADYVEERSCGF
uniref:Serpentine receptor class gamma n=1 Tax=Panagrellus redivivus TaxID=6233 RepID=A0A7E4UVN1_PANRE